MSQKFILFIFVLTSINVNAQTCCSGGIPLSNNIGMEFNDSKVFRIGLNYDYNNLSTLNNGNDNLNDDSRLRVTHSVLLNLGYSFTDRLSLEGMFSWVNQRRKITQFGNENLDQTIGVGDAVVLGKYNFKDLLGKNSVFNLGLGTKIPIGSTSETNDLGIKLNADLQPGSNALDFIYYASYSKSFDFRPSFNVSTKVIFRSTGENNEYLNNSSYEFGDETQVFLNFSDQFFLFESNITPILTLKYRNAKRDLIGGSKLENTGGDWVSLIPAFNIDLNSVITFSAKAELPIYSEVDGIQLTPTYRITSGILITLQERRTLLTKI